MLLMKIPHTYTIYVYVCVEPSLNKLLMVFAVRSVAS